VRGGENDKAEKGSAKEFNEKGVERSTDILGQAKWGASVISTAARGDASQLSPPVISKGNRTLNRVSITTHQPVLLLKPVNGDMKDHEIHSSSQYGTHELGQPVWKYMLERKVIASYQSKGERHSRIDMTTGNGCRAKDGQRSTESPSDADLPHATLSRK
jgi:hypothetical protein